jgi:hypothetical protein
MARWHKATGTDFATSANRICSAFEDAGKALLLALRRMGEVFRDMEAARAAAASKPAKAKKTRMKKPAVQKPSKKNPPSHHSKGDQWPVSTCLN